MTLRTWLIALWCVAVALLISACGADNVDEQQVQSPGAPNLINPTVVLAAPTQTPGGSTTTPSPTLPPTVTPTNSPPPPPPTGTATFTPTPGPYEHVIQSGDTCLGIAARYGHMSPDVKREIERINAMADCSILPPPGSMILIPHPTATPTAIGMDLTQTAIATSAPPHVSLDISPSFAIQQYVVQSGDTLSSIAIRFDSSLQQVCELNPLPDGIDCRACTWESANCCCTSPVVLSEGQTVNVPAPTPTPTLTPTFTGSETPTPTPTYRAPRPLLPAAGSTVSGGVRLTWMSVGVLGPNDFYLVTVRDDTTGSEYTASTRQLSLDLPTGFLPADGKTHQFAWQVSVVRLGTDGLFYPLGNVVAEQSFTWIGWE